MGENKMTLPRPRRVRHSGGDFDSSGVRVSKREQYRYVRMYSVSWNARKFLDPINQKGKTIGLLSPEIEIYPIEFGK